MNLFEKLERSAARGAEGLAPEAREELGVALLGRQCPGGGFCGLDGRADPYYSFFAWLSLRALGTPYDREGLCAYMRGHRHAAQQLDALCARILLAEERCGARLAWTGWASAFLRGDARGIYGAFLLMLATGHVPRWVARLAWLRQRRLFAAEAAGRLPTPRLAAGLALASLAGETGQAIFPQLEARRFASGGFAAAAGAAPDLLATAVARFALALAQDGRREKGGMKDADLAFIEACWQADGLFGASPDAGRGDAEHTFYGLLALGTCR